MTSTNGPKVHDNSDTMILAQQSRIDQPSDISLTTALAKARLLHSRAHELREMLTGCPRQQATSIMIRAGQLARDLDSQLGAELQPIPVLTAVLTELEIPVLTAVLTAREVAK